MALVFTYMKILDPTSVVRDSEFGLAASTDLGTFEGISLNTINKVLRGQTVLTKTQRAALISAARGATLGAYKAYESMRDGFKTIVDVRNLNPDAVLVDFTQGLNLPQFDDFKNSGREFDYYEVLQDVFDLPLGSEFLEDPNIEDIKSKVNK